MSGCLCCAQEHNLHLTFSTAESMQRLLLCILEVLCKPHCKNLIFSQKPSVEGKHQQGKLTLIHTSKGLLCTSSITTDTAHFNSLNDIPGPQKKSRLPFIPHLVVINSREQTSEYVTSSPSSLHFVHAACVAMNHPLHMDLQRAPASRFPKGWIKLESARLTCKVPS